MSVHENVRASSARRTNEGDFIDSVRGARNNWPSEGNVISVNVCHVWGFRWFWGTDCAPSREQNILK